MHVFCCVVLQRYFHRNLTNSIFSTFTTNNTGEQHPLDESDHCHNLTEQLKQNKAPSASKTLAEVIQKSKRLRDQVNHNTGNNRISELEKSLGTSLDEGDQETLDTPAKQGNKKQKTSGRSSRNTKKKNTTMSSAEQIKKLKEDLTNTKKELKAANDTIKQQKDLLDLKEKVRFGEIWAYSVDFMAKTRVVLPIRAFVMPFSRNVLPFLCANTRTWLSGARTLIRST